MDSEALSPSNTIPTWHRSVKRKLEQIEDGARYVPSSSDYSSVARVEIENECVALRETLSSQQQTIQDLYTELDEERNASSSAANEAMSMILRLQREKAEVQMEARQFKRYAEEKMNHDQQELLELEELLYKREQTIQSLTYEVQAYKHRMLSFGLTDDEIEGGKGTYSRTQSGNYDTHFEFPPFDYPPLKCSVNENQAHSDLDNNLGDLDKYAFDETSSTGEQLQNLEYRINQLENTTRSSQINGEFSGTKNIQEKVVIGQSPRLRHARRLSSGSSSSFFGIAKETVQDGMASRPTSISKNLEYFSHMEDHSNSRKVENPSDHEDDIIDRVCTIDSVHHGVPLNNTLESKAAIGTCEDNVTPSRDSLNRTDIGDPDVKKLYMRLQALEADRESMKQAIISMRTDKAQLILLREIAQQLYKGRTPTTSVPVKKQPLIWTFSFESALKWILSIIWRRKEPRIKYMVGLSANNAGLLMLLDKGPRIRQLRCLTSVQV